MANQYQNFSNPTIIPDQPMGWQAAQQSFSGFGDALKQQFLQRQALQFEIAKQASDAQMKVWAAMQDPIARALTYGKLREEGMSPNNIPQYNITSIGDLLKGNMYAGMVPNINVGYSSPSQSQPQQLPGAPGGFNMPQSTQPVGDQASSPSDFTFSAGGQFGPFVTPVQKMGAYGPTPSDAVNIGASNQVAGNKAYSEQVGAAQGKQAAGTSMLDSITRNLAADLKAHFIESAGGGPLRGRIAGLTTKIGQSPATYGLKNTVRDSAIAYARDLAGGSQGVQRLFQSIVESIPQEGASQQQAATALLQMHLTAAQLNAGIQAMGLTPEKLNGMSDAQIQDVMAHGVIDRNAETQRFSQILQNTNPTQIMDMNGKMSNPVVNPIVAQMFGQGQQQAQPQQSIKDKYNALRASGVSAQDAKKQLGL